MGRDRGNASIQAAAHPPRSQDSCPTRVQFDRWRAGDEAAFAALHSRFTPLLRVRVRRHPAWSVLKHHLQIEDVLQALWARAIPAVRDRFRDAGPGSLLAYLGTIADREMHDLARQGLTKKRGRGAVRSLPTGFERAGGSALPTSAPETPTGHARATELARLARELLTGREHEAWDLVELQGYSSDEAGLAMGSTGAAVRGLVLRSRTKLALRLQASERNASVPR